MFSVFLSTDFANKYCSFSGNMICFYKKGGDLNMSEPSISEICALVSGLRLPRWQDLPDLELYMDQVLSLVSRYLGSYPGFDRKGLTASMVNNYVKAGVVPAPVKKKYRRDHLANLIIVCILKSSLPLDAIRQMLLSESRENSPEYFYNRFCDLFEETAKASASAYLNDGDNLSVSLCKAALRAQAEQAIAIKLFSSTFPGE